MASNGGDAPPNQLPGYIISAPDSTTAAPTRGSRAQSLYAAAAAVTPPSECPTTPTGTVVAIRPRSESGTDEGSVSWSITTEMSAAWLTTSSRSSGFPDALLVKGKSGAATTKPEDASWRSSLEYVAADEPK